MKTIFILVDALKSSYLTKENMPYLYQISQNSLYVKHIIPCSGFCERSEIFSGLDGFDTGNFTAIGYMPGKSPYHNDRFSLKVFKIIELFSERVSRKLFSKWRVFRCKRMNAYRIPYQQLPKFALTEDGDSQLIKHETIFDKLEQSGKSYNLNAFTSLSDLTSRLKNKSLYEFACENVRHGVDFIPLYIGIIDNVGHRFGKDIEAIKPFLNEVDRQIQCFYELAVSNGYSIAILGDHGMIPVYEKINVQRFITKLDLKLAKDYDVFLDSTTARFWFYNKSAEIKILEMLNEKLKDKGIIIDKSNYSSYRIPLDIIGSTGKPVYGDIIWCANPGILISPDYFHTETASENGMHGYIEVNYGDGTGLFTLFSEKQKHVEIESEHSSKVCSFLCDNLDIETPNKKGWIRII